jgi:tetratricopeptide (TPR) repeat protein
LKRQPERLNIRQPQKKPMTKKSRPSQETAPLGGKPSAQPAGPGERRMVWVICLLLAAITFAVFGQTLRHGFVNYDDNRYVYENSTVTNGLTGAGIAQAFAHGSLANWDPLTTLSHMLDCQIHGLQPGGHHLTDVLLHTASAVLLFFALRKLTGALWQSAFVAAVFAIHPLHVESVAWVSERKDTLSGFFFMLTLLTYAYYAQGPPKLWRYLLLLVFYACGLMSKSMLITLPFVLLLLDYWPLGRFPDLGAKGRGIATVLRSRVVLEKLPLLALTAGSCVVAMIMQGRAIKSFDEYPFGLRLANAMVSVANYIRQMFWPAGLAVFYPYPAQGLPAVEVGVAALLLAGISIAAWRWRRTQPWLLTGWLWYVGMLVPVMGLVQIGAQAQADRYTYLPQIGLYAALTWLAWDFCRRRGVRREALVLAGMMAIAALGVVAFVQTSHWQDSESLWKHTLACTTDNAVAHNNLGSFEYQHGRNDEAAADFQKAVDIRPDFADAHCNLGSAFLQQRRVDDAITEFQKAVELQPGNPNYSGDLGAALLQKGRLDEAISAFQHSLAIRPDDYGVHNNLGVALFHAGRLDEAAEHILKALELRPGSRQVQKTLAGIAWALAASPDASVRNGPKAVELAEEADRLSGRDDPVLACVLAGAYAEAGRFPEAVATAQRALQMATAQSNSQLATAVQEQLNYYESRRPYRDAAIRIGPAKGAH